MKKIDFDILPLIIAMILILILLYIVFTSNYTLGSKQFIAISCAVISFYFYLKNRMVYYFVFGITLLVGVFGLLDFYYSTFKIGIGSFGINPLLTGLLILHIALAFQIVEKMDSKQ